jgi:hypothetical protein
MPSLISRKCHADADGVNASDFCATPLWKLAETHDERLRREWERECEWGQAFGYLISTIGRLLHEIPTARSV